MSKDVTFLCRWVARDTDDEVVEQLDALSPPPGSVSPGVRWARLITTRWPDRPRFRLRSSRKVT